jgi:hypothetical protein
MAERMIGSNQFVFKGLHSSESGHKSKRHKSE